MIYCDVGAECELNIKDIVFYYIVFTWLDINILILGIDL